MISLRHVSKAYGRGQRFALREANLEIATHAFVAVIGDSGSGKTTLLKAINRLVEVDAGDIAIEGESIRHVAAHELRRRIGYVFQGIGLFPHLSVAENIGVTPSLLGWPRQSIAERVAELIDLVRLPRDYLGRMPAELSGGQQQRVGLARSLAARPGIMLLDEPFGALDPVTRDELGGDYRRLHDAMSLTTLMVTHDVMEALLLADRIVVVRAGTIVADGAPRDLLNGGQDEGVRKLMETPRRQAERLRFLMESRSGRG
jgi:osmoprotectant transport system ATP-binding protein